MRLPTSFCDFCDPWPCEASILTLALGALCRLTVRIPRTSFDGDDNVEKRAFPSCSRSGAGSRGEIT
eukprot:5702709-Pyramimonas_sp.AAC.1